MNNTNSDTFKGSLGLRTPNEDPLPTEKSYGVNTREENTPSTPAEQENSSDKNE